MKKMQKIGIFTIGVLLSLVLFNSNMNSLSFQDQEEVTITEDPLKEWEGGKAASDPDVFISIWDTSITSDGSSASNQVTLPLESSGTYDFSVVWGDGSEDTITAYNQPAVTHTFASTGTYTINITGTIRGWMFNETGDRLKILEIQQWGCLQLGNSGDYFDGCSYLTLTATDSLNLTGTTTLVQAFRGCNKLRGSGNLNAWNVSSVTDMYGMFDGASKFDQPIGNWNVEQVTDMERMFYGARSFNQPLEAWDVSSVTGMSSMFSVAHSFNQSLNDWDVSQVTDMSQMFHYASSFNQPIGNWNVAQVTDMERMFYEASSFNQSLNDWDVSQVTDMILMFYEASSFNQSLNDWDVSQVTAMIQMFHYASSFNQPIGNWDVSSVTDMYGMFDGASLFNQPIGNWNVAQVTDMERMFYHTSSFNQPIGNWDVSQVTDVTCMFYRASSFNQSLNDWDVSSVTNMGFMFYGVQSFNQLLEAWDVSSVTDMSLMFSGASSFNQSLNDWDVSQVTRMRRMFSGASSFNQLLDNWDVSQVRYMDDIFYGVTLSTENYDSLLLGWSQLALQNRVEFHGGNSRYSSAGYEARQFLISEFDWIITDGGAAPSVPCAPRSVSSTSGRGIILTWVAPIYDGGYAILEYRVYRSIISGANYTHIATIADTVYQYNDTDVTEGIQYYYTVTAVNSIGESDYATEINVSLITESSDTTIENPAIPGYSISTLVLCFGFTIIVLLSKNKARNKY
jgi:surface protein